MNKITKAVTLSEIIALTGVIAFIGYRTYQTLHNNAYDLKHDYVKQSITNSVYLDAIYDTRRKK